MDKVEPTTDQANAGASRTGPQNAELLNCTPPRATDPAYVEAFLQQKAEAWALYRRGDSGTISFPMVRTQSGEVGHWVLVIGYLHCRDLERATILRVLDLHNEFDLPPGEAAWIPAKISNAPTVFYRVGDIDPTFNVADLHPEEATLTPLGPRH